MDQIKDFKLNSLNIQFCALIVWLDLGTNPKIMLLFWDTWLCREVSSKTHNKQEKWG